ncbi:heavy metal translocating P-type ATPase [Helicobacter aurati]|uniref:Copper-transporting ATPase n=1 Tax=Helicobacter aurati TaxID=137778 RepID=A0A3D8J2X8_9HELI|nr:heavy metal translocating P-type ATPase [Helicobacter aurati]RDU71576.1 heavy metal translocating P-type ATPase [Helicobacter aurati]
MRFSTDSHHNNIQQNRLAPVHNKPLYIKTQNHNVEAEDSAIQLLRLQIKGMSCASCSASIERALRKQQGILEANIFILTHSGIVKFNSLQCSVQHIMESIKQLGFEAIIDSDINSSTLSNQAHNSPLASAIPTNITQNGNPASLHSSPNPSVLLTDSSTQNISLFNKIHCFIENRLLTNKRRLLLSLILSAAILYISMLHEMLHLPLPAWLYNNFYNGMAQLIITLIVMHLGRTFYFRGIRALISLRPNMDSLISIGSLAGFFYSLYSLLQFGVITQEHLANWHLYFESVCVILSFVMLGKYIEENAKSLATQNATKLLERNTKFAQKILNPEIVDSMQASTASNQAIQIQEVLVDTLQIGDYIQILPQSFIPIDSLLYSPNASIDESMLSGESLPVNKEKDSLLFAGTLNTDTMIIARVTQLAKDSTINKMQMLIKQTYESKMRIALLADRISAFFVPIVIILAILSGIFWFFYADTQTALLYFSSTLLISCPCALGLATPMATLFANARANKKGVFFKSSQSLENLSKIDYIIFDKTGTLTDGNLQLHSINLIDTQSCHTKEELLKICASIETGSNHLIAKAIVQAGKGFELYKNKRTTILANAGLESTLEIDSKQRHFVIGNAKILKEKANITIMEKSQENLLTIHLAEKKQDGYQLLGNLVLQETLKQDAKETIDKLTKAGFVCEILSGDTASNVASIANLLGIKHCAECLPEDKMRYIHSLQNEGHKIMMVGDGINDAIAIAKADVSVAMASGHEVSIEYSDIIYFHKHLLGLVEILQLGKATLNNITQNLGFAFLYNSICIPIAMGIFSGFGIILNPMIASIAMSLSSISVVGNASRLYAMQKAQAL